MVMKGLLKPITDILKCSYDGIDLVNNHKTLLSVLIAVLGKKYGKGLVKQQEILLSMADIIIEIYASESALLRAKKTGEVNHLNMSKMYLYEANQKIKEKAYEIIDASSKGIKRGLLNKLAGKLTSHKHINPYHIYSFIE
jgi:hypothetical protein